MSNHTNPSQKKTTASFNSRSGFFITGTDTEIGKTYAAGCIAHTLLQQGKVVIPHKPIASGCIKQADGTLVSEDAEFLQQASQTTNDQVTICPYQFEPPISPQIAIQNAGLSISTQDLIEACQLPETWDEQTIHMIEGAGGFLSPICSDGLNRDLAQALGLPVVLVVKNQLGCINHALLSIEAIENSGLELHSIIINYADAKDFTEGLSDWTDKPIFRIAFSKDKSLQTLNGFTVK